MTDEIYHYGIPKKSGRYPWGSGENPYHHTGRKLGRKIKRRELSPLEKEEQEKDRQLRESVKKEVQRRKKEATNITIMTDEDLKKAVDRMNLENQYKELSGSQLYPVRSMFQTAMKKVGQSAITGATAYALLKITGSDSVKNGVANVAQACIDKAIANMEDDYTLSNDARVRRSKTRDKYYDSLKSINVKKAMGDAKQFANYVAPNPNKKK